MNLTQLILALIGVAAQEVETLTKPGSESNTVAVASDEFIAATKAVLAKHSENTGKPIADILATL